ncbi:MAG: peptidoglycan DD-metalloendopeptidase family protein [Pseudomonadota bacterium]
MSLHALTIAVAVFLLAPLAWSGAVASARALTRDNGAPLESGSELRVLSIMLAPVLVGGLCLAWAAAPKPYALPPLLPETHLFESAAAITSHAVRVAPLSPRFDWFGAGVAAFAVAYAFGFIWSAARLRLAQVHIARIAARASDASAAWGEGVALTESRVSAFLGPCGKVVLPRDLVETLTPAQIALIIAHERSHHRRGDAYTFAALAWVDVVCWFNPFVRAQTGRCRLAAELACDAAAIADAPQMRKAYAQALLAALKHAAGDALPCAPAASSTWIVGDHRMRIARIMQPARRPRKRALWAVYAAAGLLAAPVSMMQLAIAQPSAVHASAATTAQPNIAPSTVFSVVPVAGPITSPFGERRDPSIGPTPHNGIDFGAPVGAPILAPGAGRVITVDERPYGYGKVIEIDHGGGLVTRYAHLSAFEATEGQQVTAGQEIGRVGETGHSVTGPHLHFEVLRDGRNVDPAPLLPATH